MKPFFKKALWVIGVAHLMLLTVMIWTFHVGIFPPPDPARLQETGQAESTWIDKSQFGMSQLILKGTPYERGRLAGEKTAHLLLAQERELVGQLQVWIPSRVVLQGLVAFGVLWFQGIEDYFESWTTEEMYGVSHSAPREFDFLADGYTRQIAYHGLHEVGQLMVDQGSDDMGCTVIAMPEKKSWVVGRTFDFESGRIFDREKILKWVFPDQGNAYVSVIWAGMVGAVTGVNDQGLYISINAAGSEDFRRHGTPSTLVILKVLQFAKTIDEALEILKSANVFITDIFVLLDSRSGRLFRVEKSPKRTEVIELKEPSVVTNHLISETWAKDSVNLFRKNELTSHFREERGRLRLQEKTNLPPELRVLSILRDKGEAGGIPLHLGNRRAIDALIATHAVVLDGPREVLYVSQGPGVSGAFTGFDLAASFRQRMPVKVGVLAADPLVTPELFSNIRGSAQLISKAERLLRKKQCNSAEEVLKEVAILFQEQSGYYAAMAGLSDCRGDQVKAKEMRAKALALHPAYIKTIRQLQEKM